MGRCSGPRFQIRREVKKHLGRPSGVCGFAQACKSLQTKAHCRSGIAKAVHSGAEVNHVHNGSGLAAAERYYGSGYAAVPGKHNEGRSVLDVCGPSAISENADDRVARRMPGAAPERKRLNVRAQTERYSGGCTAMPYEVRLTMVPAQQRQSDHTVSDMYRSRASVRKGAGM